ncbi:MAG: hypothetical protein RIR97_1362, partial [Pseudomonadota bacterium]
AFQDLGLAGLSEVSLNHAWEGVSPFRCMDHRLQWL